MKKNFTLFLALIAMAEISIASDTKINGIWYDFDTENHTAAVTFRGSTYDAYDGEYSGAITIPATVKYNNVTYSVTSIGYAAFQDCSGLTSIEIPNSVTSIGSEAFSGCSGLTSVTIPNSVTSIGADAFYRCSGLTSPIYNAHVFAFLPTSYSGAYTISDGIESIAGGAFDNCTGLISVTIPNSVTSIGAYAFYHCSGLTSVTIGSSVTSIEDYAFEDCSGLTSVTFGGETPASLGNYTFVGCYNLDAIYVPCGTIDAYKSSWSSYTSKIKYAPFPYTVTTIAENGNILTTSTASYSICDEAIATCTATPNYGYHFVQWSDGVTVNPRTFIITQDTTFTAEFAYDRIGKCGKDFALTWSYSPDDKTLSISGNGALEENLQYGAEAPSQMEHVVIEDGVTIIGDSAFFQLGTIASVEIPNSVTSIGVSAFDSCYNLSAVVIPNSVTYIGKCAFYYCSGLTSIKIPNNVTNIGECAFCYCSGLTSVIIPENVQATGAFPFYGCANLRSVIWNAINCTTYDDGQYVYPPFQGCDNVTSFIIGEQVQTLPRGLCYGLPITTIVIPNSVTSIGVSAFSDCSSLAMVTLNNNEICSYNSFTSSFSICSIFGNQVEEYIIGSSVENIADNAFYNCIDLKSITIPSSIKKIGQNAFYGCNGLNDVHIFDIAAWCAMIERSENNPFNFLKEPYEIDYYVFLKNHSYNLYLNEVLLTDLIIPSSVTKIANYTFAGCKSLASAKIPNSVTNIGSSAFDRCANLTNVAIGNSVTNIGMYAFNGCAKLKNITIGDHVNTIEDLAFYKCDMTSVCIPEGCTSVGARAFAENPHLTTISIPSTVTTIGDVPVNSQRIEIVYNYAMTPQAMSVDAYGTDKVATLRSVLSLAKLYVPAQSVNLYKTAEFWRYFGEILPIQSTPVETDEITVETTETTALITWPSEVEVTSYELVIRDKNGNEVCTLIFDAEGHLLSLVFAAPARNANQQQTQSVGFSFTVTGLQSGTTYDLTITSKNSQGETVDSQTITFTTAADATAIEEVEAATNQLNSRKILFNGQIFILRGDKTYTVTGQEVR